MGKTQDPGLIDLPDGGTAAYLDKNLELTDKASALYVRVLYPDGRSVFGVAVNKEPTS
jgi:hypothetical protein